MKYVDPLELSEADVIVVLNVKHLLWPDDKFPISCQSMLQVDRYQAYMVWRHLGSRLQATGVTWQEPVQGGDGVYKASVSFQGETYSPKIGVSRELALLHASWE